MPFTPYLAGQRLTADRLNAVSMIGATVFLAYRSASQAITTGGDAGSNATSWDDVQSDLLGGWLAGSPTRWTVPQTGWWRLAGAVAFDASTGGTTRECVWYVNGSAIGAGRARTFGNTLASVPVTVEARTLSQLLTAGDYVQLVPAQNSGSNLNLATGSYRSYIDISYAGPA
ncbi:hypothetical protein OG393_20935 [Streptomyces sp. NBC_01216]|uniref:hypothetical protein n=1 Tax=Streptomyces sp. NBC_01216 TaxID=2903778 RepID=UPI002E0D798D|nr:hypothetical protein OG393_20935 [Streptomyces sp. NBC_01216]